MFPVKWTVKGGRVVNLPPFLIMGIVNVTPDSFSDGGNFFNTGKAVEHALELWHDGAGILDIGGESTRPGSDFVSQEEELARIEPVLAALIQKRAEHNSAEAYESFPLLSVDTWRAGTSRKVLEMGVDIINDVSGATFDEDLARVIAEHKPGYVLGHSPEPPRIMQNAPAYRNVVNELYTYFANRISDLMRAGLPAECIVLDPGLGFGKTMQHNLDILRNLERFATLGCPMCIGISRKTVFGDLLGLEKGLARDPATQIVTALTAERGALIHRVHDVKGAANALKITGAISGKAQ